MRWAPLILLLGIAAATRPAHASAPEGTYLPLPPRVTGANLRPVGDPRRGYGSKTARATMQRLADLGVNTLAVLLEGRMAGVDDDAVRPPGARALAEAEAALLDARALGLATVLIPHLYLDDGAWRGDLRLQDGARRQRWWRSYAAFIGAAAGVAERSRASALSIGVELKSLSASAETRAQMAALAQDVRRRYGGKLTYSANWDEAEQVRFWEVVDYAGVNGYYPLLPEPVRGAEQVARRLSALAERAGREVLVLEVGYRSSPLSHVRPWEWPDHVEEIVDERSQLEAWAAALTHWLPAPGVRGLLVWVVPTDPDDPASEPRHGFNPLNKAAEELLGKVFRQKDKS